MKRLIVLAGPLIAVAVAAIGDRLLAQDEYERPVDMAPVEEDIGGGYVVPAVQRPLPRAAWLNIADVVLLAAAMGVSAWLLLHRRSRNGLVVLTVGSLLYFGFYRQGCVCPIGAIQNVAVALTDPIYAVS